VGVTFVGAEQSDDVRKIARRLSLQDEFGRMDSAGRQGQGRRRRRRR
jgi:hypothetical protein